MYRFKHICGIIAISLFFFNILTAQVSSELSSKKVDIGEKNTYTLRVQSNDSSTIQLLPWQTNQNIEFFNESPWILNGKSFEKTWDLIAWDSGAYTIPPMNINVGSLNFETNPHNLFVGDIQLPDSTQLADIKPIIEETATLEDYLNIIYLAVFICLLGFVVWYVYKKNQAQLNLLDPPSEELKRPAHIIALQALENLDQRNMLSNGQEEAYETELSYISRKYISDRFGILALEKGNEAFMKDLQSLKDIPKHIKSKMLDMLPSIELVKYAGQSLPTETHIEYRSTIGQLITETTTDSEQKYILEKEDEILQEAIEEGMRRTLSLGAVKKLNKLLIKSGHYGSESSEVILCNWTFNFPFLKAEAAAIELPKPIIDWHNKGISTFFSLYNKIGLRLTNAGIIGILIFLLIQPLFLVSSVVFIILDLIKGKRIFGLGNIILEDKGKIKFLYKVLENDKNPEL